MSLVLAAGGGHAHLDFGGGIGSLALRVVLLAAVAGVTAFALLRGFVGEPSRFTRVAVTVVASSAATMQLLVSGGLNLPEQVVPLLLAALAAPVYLVLSRDERFAPAVGFGRRVAPLVFAAVAVLAAVQLGLAWLTGAGDVRTAIVLHTGVLLGLVALVWFAVAAPRGRRTTVALRVGAALLAMAMLAGTAQAVTLRRPEPTPGVANAVRLEVGPAVADVTVVPNLPGWNLVHVDDPAAAVGLRADALAPVWARAGTTGGWVSVELPAGRSDVWVRIGQARASFPTDTGGSGTAPVALAGADGPECASALLGRMLAAGTATGGERCPSERLDPIDAAALVDLLDSVAAGGHRRAALVADRSPRGVEAQAAARSAATAAGVELVAPNTPGVPLLITSGWTAAASALAEAGERPTYLAPWLLTEPLLAAGQHIALRYDVSDASFQRYRYELGESFSTQSASAAGYRAWLAERREPEAGPVRVIHPSTLD